MAAESAETALAIWPDEPDWHALAATMYQDAGKYPEAAKHLEEAIRIAQKRLNTGKCSGCKTARKRLSRCQRLLGKATDLFPSDPEALHSLAIINQQLGEHQIAIQCLRKASQLDPGNILYEEGIAHSLLARQDLPEAVQQADAILKTDPKNETAWQVKSKHCLRATNQRKPGR